MPETFLSILRRRVPAALTGLAATALPLAAAAHPALEGGAHHEVLAGFLHPFLGADHLAAMVAVGLWSAQAARGRRELLAAPLAFASMLLVGALFGSAGWRTAAVEPMVAASLLVLGLLAAARLRLPGVLCAAAVGGFALFHGLAHGAELSGGGALVGMVLATAALHGAGLAAGLALRERGAWLVRAAGAAVAAFGIALLAQAA
ncbi:MAG: HupE/UreJ family protein [Comamonadaceae bacterium]|nr:MAG: HupE/UreJ family protein [Comamonadaceae bacterium]